MSNSNQMNNQYMPQTYGQQHNMGHDIDFDSNRQSEISQNKHKMTGLPYDYTIMTSEAKSSSLKESKKLSSHIPTSNKFHTGSIPKESSIAQMFAEKDKSNNSRSVSKDFSLNNSQKEEKKSGRK